MPTDPLTADELGLLAEARAVARRSLAPPREQAGAVALTAAGGRFPGVAVRLETAVGLSACAEQVALCAARAGGPAPIIAVALWLPAAAGEHPCGRCLQTWRELAPQAPMILQRGDDTPVRLGLDRLLPDPFTHFEPQA